MCKETPPASIMDSSSKMFSFFKAFIPENSSQYMRIPPAVAKDFKVESVPKKVVVRDEAGKCCNVTVEQVNDKTVFFKNGWKEFARDHVLEYGDLLIFRYDGNGKFDVEIFIKSGRKKELKPASGTSTSSSSSVVIIEQEPSFIPCKRKHSESNYTVQKSTRGSKTLPKLGTSKNNADGRAVFEREMRPKSDAAIYFSRSVLNANNIMLKNKMVVKNEKGRAWPVTVACSGHYQGLITTGWRVFFEDNNLTVGDKCVFEFITDADKNCEEILVKVTRSSHATAL